MSDRRSRDMHHHTGTCVGGPLDGQKLDHWAKRKELLRPLPGSDDVISIGEYRINDYGQWHWHGTQEGRAHDVLYGTDDQK